MELFNSYTFSLCFGPLSILQFIQVTNKLTNDMQNKIDTIYVLCLGQIIESI